MTPPLLIHRAQAGEESAFEQLYAAVQPGLLRYLRLLVGDDAEDVASETWLRIVHDLHTFTGDDQGFKGWAATIARHRAIDHLRYRQRRPAIVTAIDDLTDLPARDDTATAALDQIGTESAIALIATLPPDQAEAVLLRAVLGLDAKTAGKVMGKRAGAVRTAAYRGLQRLADRLNTPTPRATPAPADTDPASGDGQAAVTSLTATTVKETR